MLPGLRSNYLKIPIQQKQLTDTTHPKLSTTLPESTKLAIKIDNGQVKVCQADISELLQQITKHHSRGLGIKLPTYAAAKN